MKPLTQSHVVGKTAEITTSFLERRIAKISSNDITQFLTVNPLLLASVAEFHAFRTVADIANFLFVAHMSTGHSTGFGKLVDEKLLPSVFGTIKLDKALRAQRGWQSTHFNEIDHIVFPDSSDWCLLSVKAGAWTIQDSMARNLYTAFSSIIDFNLQGSGIVVGVFYGHSGDLTNKYQILRGADKGSRGRRVELTNVRVLAGKEFWTWLNGGEEQTQFWVLEGIRQAASAFGTDAHGQTVRNAPSLIEEQLVRKYGLVHGEPIDWFSFLNAVNSNNLVTDHGDTQNIIVAGNSAP